MVRAVMVAAFLSGVAGKVVEEQVSARLPFAFPFLEYVLAGVAGIVVYVVLSRTRVDEFLAGIIARLLGR